MASEPLFSVSLSMPSIGAIQRFGTALFATVGVFAAVQFVGETAGQSWSITLCGALTGLLILAWAVGAWLITVVVGLVAFVRSEDPRAGWLRSVTLITLGGVIADGVAVYLTARFNLIDHLGTPLVIGLAVATALAMALFPDLIYPAWRRVAAKVLHMRADDSFVPIEEIV